MVSILATGYIHSAILVFCFRHIVCSLLTFIMMLWHSGLPNSCRFHFLTELLIVSTVSLVKTSLLFSSFSEGEYCLCEDSTPERNGRGVHSTSDGTVYTGAWTADKMNGQGHIVYASGASYEGDFVNNQFHGKGKYTWPNGSYYVGDFMENKCVCHSSLVFNIHLE